MFHCLNKNSRNFTLAGSLAGRVVALCVILLTATHSAGFAAEPRDASGRSIGRQAVASSPGARGRADSPEDRRPARTITRRANSSSTAERRSGSKATSTTTFWKTTGSLALIVVLILAAGRILKKRDGAFGHALPTEAVELLGRRSIDGRQVIHLVRLGSRILVLGSSSEGLRSLAEITDPVEIDYLAGLCRSGNVSSGITATFRSLLTGRQQPDSDEPPSDFDATFSTTEPSRVERFSADSSRQPDAELHHVPG